MIGTDERPDGGQCRTVNLAVVVLVRSTSARLTELGGPAFRGMHVVEIVPSPRHKYPSIPAKKTGIVYLLKGSHILDFDECHAYLGVHRVFAGGPDLIIV